MKSYMFLISLSFLYLTDLSGLFFNLMQVAQYSSKNTHHRIYDEGRQPRIPHVTLPNIAQKHLLGNDFNLNRKTFLLAIVCNHVHCAYGRMQRYIHSCVIASNSSFRKKKNRVEVGISTINFSVTRRFPSMVPYRKKYTLMTHKTHSVSLNVFFLMCLMFFEGGLTICLFSLFPVVGHNVDY